MAENGAMNARCRKRWVVIGLLALGLAACGTPQPPSADSVPATLPAPKEDAPNTAEPTAVVPPQSTDSGAKLPEPKSPEVAMTVPAGALPGPERLMGLSGDELKSLLGTPGFVRRDPPAEIWQYGTDGCVLDLFLYTGKKGTPYRVNHFEFRGRTVAGVVPADCYRQLLAARATAN